MYSNNKKYFVLDHGRTFRSQYFYSNLIFSQIYRTQYKLFKHINVNGIFFVCNKTLYKLF